MILKKKKKNFGQNDRAKGGFSTCLDPVAPLCGCDLSALGRLQALKSLFFRHTFQATGYRYKVYSVILSKGLCAGIKGSTFNCGNGKSSGHYLTLTIKG